MLPTDSGAGGGWMGANLGVVESNNAAAQLPQGQASTPVAGAVAGPGTVAPTTPGGPANIGAPDQTYVASVNGSNVGQALSDLAEFGLQGADAQAAVDWYKQQEEALSPPAQMQIDMYQQPWFQKAFPGIIQQIKNGQTPMSPQDYITFKQGVKSFNSTFGIPDGFVTDNDIANMVGRGWTFDTFTQRMGIAFNAAANAAANNPEAVALLDKWYGIKPGSGALAAFMLDPNKSVAVLAQATEAAQAGATAEAAGFKQIDQHTLMSLAANQSLAAIQSGVAAAVPLLPGTQAWNGPNAEPKGFKNASSTPQQGPLTEKDLLAAQLGNVPGETQQQALQRENVVIGGRTAAFKGGGGVENAGQPGQPTGAGFGTQ